MKNKIIALAISLALLVSLAGCNYDSVQKEKSNDGISMFTVIEQTKHWRVVYHNKTKVMYTVSAGSDNCGTFTLLVDSDGEPLIYNGE